MADAPAPKKVGQFPYHMYVAQCDCADGTPEPTLSYAKHPVAPPKCSGCRRPYQLDIRLAK